MARQNRAVTKLGVRLVINVHQCPQRPGSGLGTSMVNRKITILGQEGTGSRINFGLKESFDSTLIFFQESTNFMKTVSRTTTTTKFQSAVIPVATINTALIKLKHL